MRADQRLLGGARHRLVRRAAVAHQRLDGPDGNLRHPRLLPRRKDPRCPCSLRDAKPRILALTLWLTFALCRASGLDSNAVKGLLVTVCICVVLAVACTWQLATGTGRPLAPLLCCIVYRQSLPLQGQRLRAGVAVGSSLHASV